MIKVLRNIKHCILATDLALFFPNRAKLAAIVEKDQFTWDNKEHRLLLQAVAMTGSDLCASSKPWDVQAKTVRFEFSKLYSVITHSLLNYDWNVLIGQSHLWRILWTRRRRTRSRACTDSNDGSNQVAFATGFASRFHIRNLHTVLQFALSTHSGDETVIGRMSNQFGEVETTGRRERIAQCEQRSTRSWKRFEKSIDSHRIATQPWF